MKLKKYEKLIFDTSTLPKVFNMTYHGTRLILFNDLLDPVSKW